MDPIIGGALISGASSLLGGIFGKPKNEYVVPNYQKIRNKAEAAGFNPLTALAMAPGQVVQSQNFMGSAIADAGLALADGLNTKRKEQGALAKLAEENDKLREKVQNMTLRPKVGGVYAQREAIPSVSQAVGGGSGQADTVLHGNGAGNGAGAPAVSGAATVNLRPLMDVSPVDPRRGVDNQKVTMGSGFMGVDNPYLPFPVYFPTVDGDEALHWYDYPDLVLPVLGSAALHYSGIKPTEVMARKAWNDAQPKRPSTPMPDKASRLRKAFSGFQWPTGAPAFGQF